MTGAVVLAVMLSLAQAWEDRAETPAQRAELLTPWADAIATEARSTDEAAALVAVSWHESGGYARWVVEGRCHERPKACDHGRAKGPFQVHGWCKATDPAGQTACARSLLAFSFRRCHTWARAFGAYGTGGDCRAYANRDATRLLILRRMSDM